MASTHAVAPDGRDPARGGVRPLAVVTRRRRGALAQLDEQADEVGLLVGLLAQPALPGTRRGRFLGAGAGGPHVEVTVRRPDRPPRRGTLLVPGRR